MLATKLEEAVVAELDPLEQFKNATRLKLAGLICSAHGKAPMLNFHGSTLREIRISMRCCCGKLSMLANQAIARASY